MVKNSFSIKLLLGSIGLLRRELIKRIYNVINEIYGISNWHWRDIEKLRKCWSKWNWPVSVWYIRAIICNLIIYSRICKNLLECDFIDISQPNLIMMCSSVINKNVVPIHQYKINDAIIYGIYREYGDMDRECGVKFYAFFHFFLISPYILIH